MFTTVFFAFSPLIVSRMRKENTRQDTRISQLVGITEHINNRFVPHNVGVMMGMPVVQ